METFKDALICRNGHTVTGNITGNPDLHEKFCSKCSAETISNCPHCNERIRGYRSGSITPYTPPSFCYNCGKPFPWIEIKLQAAKELLIISDLDINEQKDFEESLIEVTSDNPRTGLAGIKIKKYLSKAGQTAGGAIKDIIVQVATDVAKSQMGL